MLYLIGGRATSLPPDYSRIGLLSEVLLRRF